MLRQIALKEWAVVISALESGEQICLMRKGGIAEETKDFQVKSDSFYMYPTYEHQRKSLLKPEFQDRIEETLSGLQMEKVEVQITSVAKLVKDIEITDEAALERLLPHHIWTEAFADERLRWKRTKPLHVLIVRVYKLAVPFKLSVSSDFLGCKSWIEFYHHEEISSLDPVLSDEVFAEQMEAIEAALSKIGEK
ncbi:DUF1802 family protein [Paenibacillus sp. N1-5-1-14]|uniref:DUF1802 family protein n=1 Tax=Paenibacillus radicibacter TaxID=2972488 RepID=UPI0021592186|nr:DUF1802 family protein [Paenibacillus radicibacter]MCR8643670.1 DUF1802 family protein [Paenibacillus radicibacter]